jgi:hypothetical protein
MLMQPWNPGPIKTGAPYMSAVDAFHEYERAIASMRADVVRALVDEGGLSLTDVAKHLKISRQAASRLYEPGL